MNLLCCLMADECNRCHFCHAKVCDLHMKVAVTQCQAKAVCETCKELVDKERTFANKQHQWEEYYNLTEATNHVGMRGGVGTLPV